MKHNMIHFQISLIMVITHYCQSKSPKKKNPTTSIYFTIGMQKALHRSRNCNSKIAKVKKKNDILLCNIRSHVDILMDYELKEYISRCILCYCFFGNNSQLCPISAPLSNNAVVFLIHVPS